MCDHEASGSSPPLAATMSPVISPERTFEDPDGNIAFPREEPFLYKNHQQKVFVRFSNPAFNGGIVLELYKIRPPANESSDRSLQREHGLNYGVNVKLENGQAEIKCKICNTSFNWEGKPRFFVLQVGS